MKASVNYVGTSSMIIGIRVESENIQTGKSKHCNSSYFTMVAKNNDGENMPVPTLNLVSWNDVRRFYNALKIIELKKERDLHEIVFEYKSQKALDYLNKYNVLITGVEV